MRELARTRHFVVELDEERHIVRRIRTAERFESVAQVEEEYAGVERAYQLVDRTLHAQLIDVRLAPPRNDPEFEEIVRRHHAALYRGFRASALLAQSAVGKLHIKRLLEASGVEASVFGDEAEAIAFLTEAIAKRG
jgi:hypothetical protein